uniref:Reverse transcriptase domain-containing protein n=1 Tax=Tanacetum cinerariifolium TaxID=118510 RepID=A0A699J8S5_TANCI|nr:hypothetical protein [Tanacetum cinerariifolium]
MEKIWKKYGVHHRIATTYHPQASGQIKKPQSVPLYTNFFMEKRVIFCLKLNILLIGPCKAAILTLRLQEKNDFCSCMSSMNCDFKHMRIPNSTKPEPKPIMIKKLRVRNEFKVEFKVLMYDSKYKFNAPKIRPKWCGPFTVRHDYPSEYVELYDKHGGSFIVNGHRVKLYYVDEQLNKHTIEKIHLMFEEGIMKAIPFMAPFPTDYHETMPWASEKPYIYNVVENTCNKAKLYDLDETGKGIVIKKCLYILGDEASLEKK